MSVQNIFATAFRNQSFLVLRVAMLNRWVGRVVFSTIGPCLLGTGTFRWKTGKSRSSKFWKPPVLISGGGFKASGLFMDGDHNFHGSRPFQRCFLVNHHTKPRYLSQSHAGLHKMYRPGTDAGGLSTGQMVSGLPHELGYHTPLCRSELSRFRAIV